MPRSEAQTTRPSLAAITGPFCDVRKVEAQVHLLVDLLAVVDVVADVGEIGLFLAPVDERPVPQNLLFGLEAQVRQLLVVLAAHLAVDLEEAREQVLPGSQLAGRVHRVDQLLHQLVVQVEIAHAEFLGEELEPEVGRGLRCRRGCAQRPRASHPAAGPRGRRTWRTAGWRACPAAGSCGRCNCPRARRPRSRSREVVNVTSSMPPWLM